MSATLDPIDNHLKLIGLSNLESTIAIGHAAWRSKAYSVAIDARVDTRYKNRSHYYETTAQTIATLYNETSNQTVAIFFPSYHYAETIKTYIETIDFTVFSMPQKKTSAYKSKKTSLKIVSKNRAILFLVLGSAFTEGIDTLGGQIETAMVISPALPEVNPLNEMKLQYEKQSDPVPLFKKPISSLLSKNPSGTQRSTCTRSWAYGGNPSARKTFSSARISVKSLLMNIKPRP